METLRAYHSLRLESVHETKPFFALSAPRRCSRVLRDPGFWLSLQIGTWLASGPFSRPLPWRFSALLFVWIPLEANLGLSLLRSKAASTTSSVLEPTQGNPTPFSLL